MNILRVPRLTSLIVVAGALSLLASAQTMGADSSAPAQPPAIEDLADSAIGGCLNYAAEKKLPPLSVAVLDDSGALVRFERQSGASPLTAEAATLKARTVVQTRSSTAELAPQAQEAAVRDVFILLHLTTLPGGVPLLRGDSSLMGAVGVSGAETADDAECAQRALAAVHDTLGAASTPGDRPRSRSEAGARQVTRAIRRRLLEFQNAWNRADLAAVVSQYDTSLSAIWQPEFVDYDGYLKSVRDLMSGKGGTAPKIRLEIHAIRALGLDYAVVNGRAFTTYEDGHELKEIFTIIYKRCSDEWKLVYVHSGFN